MGRGSRGRGAHGLLTSLEWGSDSWQETFEMFVGAFEVERRKEGAELGDAAREVRHVL